MTIPDLIAAVTRHCMGEEVVFPVRELLRCTDNVVLRDPNIGSELEKTGLKFVLLQALLKETQ